MATKVTDMSTLSQCENEKDAEFIDWLVLHLNKGDIDGLNWINRHSSVFEISWHRKAGICSIFNSQKTKAGRRRRNSPWEDGFWSTLTKSPAIKNVPVPEYIIPPSEMQTHWFKFIKKSINVVDETQSSVVKNKQLPKVKEAQLSKVPEKLLPSVKEKQSSATGEDYVGNSVRTSKRLEKKRKDSIVEDQTTVGSNLQGTTTHDCIDHVTHSAQSNSMYALDGSPLDTRPSPLNSAHTTGRQQSGSVSTCTVELSPLKLGGSQLTRATPVSKGAPELTPLKSGDSQLTRATPVSKGAPELTLLKSGGSQLTRATPVSKGAPELTPLKSGDSHLTRATPISQGAPELTPLKSGGSQLTRANLQTVGDNEQVKKQTCDTMCEEDKIKCGSGKPRCSSDSGRNRNIAEHSHHVTVQPAVSGLALRSSGNKDNVCVQLTASGLALHSSSNKDHVCVGPTASGLALRSSSNKDNVCVGPTASGLALRSSENKNTLCNSLQPTVSYQSARDKGNKVTLQDNDNESVQSHTSRFSARLRNSKDSGQCSVSSTVNSSASSRTSSNIPDNQQYVKSSTLSVCSVSNSSKDRPKCALGYFIHTPDSGVSSTSKFNKETLPSAQSYTVQRPASSLPLNSTGNETQQQHTINNSIHSQISHLSSQYTRGGDTNQGAPSFSVQSPTSDLPCGTCVQSVLENSRTSTSDLPCGTSVHSVMENSKPCTAPLKSNNIKDYLHHSFRVFKHSVSSTLPSGSKSDIIEIVEDAASNQFCGSSDKIDTSLSSTINIEEDVETGDKNKIDNSQSSTINIEEDVETGVKNKIDNSQSSTINIEEENVETGDKNKIDNSQSSTINIEEDNVETVDKNILSVIEEQLAKDPEYPVILQNFGEYVASYYSVLNGRGPSETFKWYTSKFRDGTDSRVYCPTNIRLIQQGPALLRLCWNQPIDGKILPQIVNGYLIKMAKDAQKNNWMTLGYTDLQHFDLPVSHLPNGVVYLPLGISAIKGASEGPKKVITVKCMIQDSVCHDVFYHISGCGHTFKKPYNVGLPSDKTAQVEIAPRENKKTVAMCKVCGGLAAGEKSGVPSCTKCKAFFLRHMTNSRYTVHACKTKTGRCILTCLAEIQCDYCWFNRCISVGMHARMSTVREKLCKPSNLRLKALYNGDVKLMWKAHWAVGLFFSAKCHIKVKWAGSGNWTVIKECVVGDCLYILERSVVENLTPKTKLGICVLIDGVTSEIAVIMIKSTEYENGRISCLTYSTADPSSCNRRLVYKLKMLPPPFFEMEEVNSGPTILRETSVQKHFTQESVADASPKESVNGTWQKHSSETRAEMSSKETRTEKSGNATIAEKSGKASSPLTGTDECLSPDKSNLVLVEGNTKECPIVLQRQVISGDISRPCSDVITEPVVDLEATPVFLTLQSYYRTLCEVRRVIPIKKQIAKECFRINEHWMEKIRSSRDKYGRYKIQVQLRFCKYAEKGVQPDTVPECLINMNGKRVARNLHQSVRGKETENDPNQPIDLTQYCVEYSSPLQELKVNLKPSSVLKYCMFVRVVEKMGVNEMLHVLKEERMLQSRVTAQLVKSKFEVDADSGIRSTSIKAKLTCPLSQTRIDTPCRGSECKHIQCMDALTVLQMCDAKRRVKCFICDEPFKDIVIDGFFMELLSFTGPSVDEVEFKPDGSCTFLRCNGDPYQSVDLDDDELTIPNDDCENEAWSIKKQSEGNLYKYIFSSPAATSSSNTGSSDTSRTTTSCSIAVPSTLYDNIDNSFGYEKYQHMYEDLVNKSACPQASSNSPNAPTTNIDGTSGKEVKTPIRSPKKGKKGKLQNFRSPKKGKKGKLPKPNRRLLKTERELQRFRQRKKQIVTIKPNRKPLFCRSSRYQRSYIGKPGSPVTRGSSCGISRRNRVLRNRQLIFSENKVVLAHQLQSCYVSLCPFRLDCRKRKAEQLPGDANDKLTSEDNSEQSLSQANISRLVSSQVSNNTSTLEKATFVSPGTRSNTETTVSKMSHVYINNLHSKRKVLEKSAEKSASERIGTRLNNARTTPVSPCRKRRKVPEEIHSPISITDHDTDCDSDADIHINKSVNTDHLGHSFELSKKHDTMQTESLVMSKNQSLNMNLVLNKNQVPYQNSVQNPLNTTKTQTQTKNQKLNKSPVETPVTTKTQTQTRSQTLNKNPVETPNPVTTKTQAQTKNEKLVKSPVKTPVTTKTQTQTKSQKLNKNPVETPNPVTTKTQAQTKEEKLVKSPVETSVTTKTQTQTKSQKLNKSPVETKNQTQTKIQKLVKSPVETPVITKTQTQTKNQTLNKSPVETPDTIKTQAQTKRQKLNQIPVETSFPVTTKTQAQTKSQKLNKNPVETPNPDTTKRQKLNQIPVETSNPDTTKTQTQTKNQTLNKSPVETPDTIKTQAQTKRQKLNQIPVETPNPVTTKTQAQTKSQKLNKNPVETPNPDTTKRQKLNQIPVETSNPDTTKTQAQTKSQMLIKNPVETPNPVTTKTQTQTSKQVLNKNPTPNKRSYKTTWIAVPSKKAKLTNTYTISTISKSSTGKRSTYTSSPAETGSKSSTGKRSAYTSSQAETISKSSAGKMDEENALRPIVIMDTDDESDTETPTTTSTSIPIGRNENVERYITSALKQIRNETKLQSEKLKNKAKFLSLKLRNEAKVHSEKIRNKAKLDSEITKMSTVTNVHEETSTSTVTSGKGTVTEEI